MRKLSSVSPAEREERDVSIHQLFERFRHGSSGVSSEGLNELVNACKLADFRLTASAVGLIFESTKLAGRTELNKTLFEDAVRKIAVTKEEIFTGCFPLCNFHCFLSYVSKRYFLPQRYDQEVHGDIGRNRIRRGTDSWCFFNFFFFFFVSFLFFYNRLWRGILSSSAKLNLLSEEVGISCVCARALKHSTDLHLSQQPQTRFLMLCRGGCRKPINSPPAKAGDEKDEFSGRVQVSGPFVPTHEYTVHAYHP